MQFKQLGLSIGIGTMGFRSRVQFIHSSITEGYGYRDTNLDLFDNAVIGRNFNCELGDGWFLFGKTVVFSKSCIKYQTDLSALPIVKS